MFAYPSGTGLHVGHPLGYIGTDVFARFLRMTGHTVLHAYGYDAFGLPAEQFAIGTGQHPAVTTRRNISVMRRQLRRLGLGHDWRREIATTDPGFYRWTQWMFLRIFGSWYDEEQGRARPVAELDRRVRGGDSGAGRPGEPRRAAVGGAGRGDAAAAGGWPQAGLHLCGAGQLVPGLGTVLANEEVTADGRSDVGNYPVYRRPLRQWMLRITAYAQRLLADLEPLDWPEPIKALQRNWIGPSDGATIWFPVSGGACRPRAREARAARRRGSAPSRRGRTRWPAPRSWCWRRSIRWPKPADHRGAAAGGGGVPAAGPGDDGPAAGGVGSRRPGRSPAATPSTRPPAARIPVFIADYVLIELRHRGHHGRSCARRAGSGVRPQVRAAGGAGPRPG